MMDIDDDDILRSVAAGGSMDYSVWPALLASLVSRIENIAHNEFPIPNLPPPPPTVIPSSIPHPAPSDSEDTENFLPPLPSSPTNPPSTTSSQDTNKENAPVAPRSAPPPTSVPAPGPEPLAPGTLPQQIAAMLAEITTTLTSTFPKYPPHTVQRLAELVLAPKHHYKSLPSYLHALDRVVHVTSGLNIYPLPPAVPEVPTGGVLSNGVSDTNGPNPFATPGSDEALGGALLTPIPWLQNSAAVQALSPQPQQQAPQPQPQPQASAEGETASGRTNGNGHDPADSPELRTESTETIDGPNGMGHIETVTVTVNGISSMGTRGVGVTQGELLRQEQRAGVVPVSQLASHHAHHHPQQQLRAAPSASAGPAAGGAAAPIAPGTGQSEGAPASSDATASTSSIAAAEQAVESGEVVGTVAGADEDEKPHARGPEEIGPEDMGPQREGSSATSYVGGPGVEMQGIDVEAAVGRKATESHHTSPEPKPSSGAEETKEDAMDGIEKAATTRVRSSTPKREAEDELEGVTKKLKEDAGSTDVPVDAPSSEEPKEKGEVPAQTTAADAEGPDEKKPDDD
ncbi:uncharacterized protein JN550_013639 [Neoarthrinium moseri]|uniref:uncharacterized protein n=1 Tax=Neoarthrinium moseri TaxID=1658444 RepID=UPI001FDC4E41|nr:uncharacterized protein JN550_013639 [Neoarthrinium moseri]KAI1856865.1 hypothetical protein JN550_013639 [Neoarthrinium moseri]